MLSPSPSARPSKPASPRRAAPAQPPATRLVYVSDAEPGLQRRRHGRGFRYLQADGSPLRDAAALRRIRQLAIPPAYDQVWICPQPDGHLQATGRDVRGRKQYLYHPAWREERDAAKFDRMLAFGLALPRLRARVDRDLAGVARGQPAGGPADDAALRKRRVTAAIVRLLDTTCMRVGNDEYARDNGSYGLTTLRRRHASLDGETVHLRFRGKSGVQHAVALSDPRVARVVRGCQSLAGQELFGYADAAGVVHGVGSGDVNAYLKEASGEDFTAKDFRTWHATAQALDLLLACPPCTPALAKRAANDALRAVAARLGNTLAVCRKSYVHPGVVAQFLHDGLATLRALPSAVRGASRLPAMERRVVAFLLAARRADAAALRAARTARSPRASA